MQQLGRLKMQDQNMTDQEKIDR